MSTPALTASVVVVNYNGLDVTPGCLESLRHQTYPSELWDVIVIDNASADGSPEEIAKRFPEVRLVRNKDNTGFSPAVNQGARLSERDVVVLINPDAVAEPEWLERMLAPMHNDPDVACVGGLVLDEAGKKIDFAGGEASFYGHGFQAHQNDPIDIVLRAGPTLFATGASLACRRDVFLESGGLDEEFFAYFEDVDFGWRLWVLGHKVWFAPDAVVHHIGHTTVKRFPPERWRYLLERNALATIYKNYGEAMLARALPGALMLVIARGLVVDDGSDLGDYRIKSEYAGKPAPTPQLTSGAGAHLAAVRDFTLWLESLNLKREEIQSKRRRRDDDILTLFRKGLVPNHPDPAFLKAFAVVADTFNLPFPAQARQRVVIATGDVIGERMAGPAIRAWEMARYLAPNHDVRLASTQKPEISRKGSGRGGAHRDGYEDFEVGHLTSLTWRAYADWADVLIVQGSVLTRFPDLARSDTYVAVDAYDPFQLEGLVRAASSVGDGHSDDRAQLEARLAADRLNRADVVFCASDRQRQWLLGQLLALGRIDPEVVRVDPALKSLVRVVPFGLPDAPPTQGRHGLREAFPQITDEDVVLLWGGGIYEWFDPASLVRGVAKAVADGIAVKLVFIGTKHPNATVPSMARAEEAAAVARELGLLGTHVFIHDGWVPYEERADWLLDAHVGVSTHFQSIETELAYRTRMLDYFWAGLPILCTEGDAIAEEVRSHGLGEVVAEADVDGIARAIARLADAAHRDEVAARVRQHAVNRRWSTVLMAVAEFVDAPELVAVKNRDKYLRPEGSRRRTGMFRRRTPGQLVRMFVAWAREKGLKDAFSAGVNSLRVRRAASKVGQE